MALPLLIAKTAVIGVGAVGLAGGEQLYQYCRQHKANVSDCGKWLLANWLCIRRSTPLTVAPPQPEPGGLG